MTYEELWDTAYAIGYHQGRNPEAYDTGQEAFRSLVETIPQHWMRAANKRHAEGISEGKAVL